MTLREKLKTERFIVTVEFGPDKGIETGRLLEIARSLVGRVDGFNVTDLQSSVMRLGSLALCIKFRQAGLEPVLQLTCRDRNRLALQSELLSAAAFGVENALILTGDHPVLGDDPAARPVFDLDSVQLLAVARGLERGRDAAGNELAGPFPSFCLGAVVNPGSEPMDLQLLKMEKKIAAGAEFFQTQAVYDPALFERFMTRAGQFGVPVIAGLVFLKSAGMARYMNENVAGVAVPDALVRRMAAAPKEKRVDESLRINAELVRALRPMCRGVHLMPIGWEKHLGRALAEAGLDADGGR